MPPNSKSERNQIDKNAAIGMGATNVMDRVAAMVGDIKEEAEFRPPIICHQYKLSSTSFQSSNYQNAIE